MDCFGSGHVIPQSILYTVGHPLACCTTQQYTRTKVTKSLCCSFSSFPNINYGFFVIQSAELSFTLSEQYRWVHQPAEKTCSISVTLALFIFSPHSPVTPTQIFNTKCSEAVDSIQRHLGRKH